MLVPQKARCGCSNGKNNRLREGEHWEANIEAPIMQVIMRVWRTTIANECSRMMSSDVEQIMIARAYFGTKYYYVSVTHSAKASLDGSVLRIAL